MAPDDPGRAEGIAGRAWAANRGGVVVEGLPELGDNPEESLVQDYAERTHVSRSGWTGTDPAVDLWRGFRSISRTVNAGAYSCWTARIRP